MGKATRRGCLLNKVQRERANHAATGDRTLQAEPMLPGDGEQQIAQVAGQGRTKGREGTGGGGEPGSDMK